jgi:hypothetical protein
MDRFRRLNPTTRKGAIDKPVPQRASKVPAAPIALLCHARGQACVFRETALGVIPPVTLRATMMRTAKPCT